MKITFDLNLNNLRTEQERIAESVVNIDDTPTNLSYQTKIFSVETIQYFQDYSKDNNDPLLGFELVPLIEDSGELKIYLSPIFKKGGTGPVPGPGVG